MEVRVCDRRRADSKSAGAGTKRNTDRESQRDRDAPRIRVTPNMAFPPIKKLIQVLADCEAADWGNDPVFGKGTFNVGILRGGQAANIVPPEAYRSIMIRTVEPGAIVEARLRRIVDNRATIEIVGASDALLLHVVDGFETTIVSFGSDAPHLPNTGKRLMIGPGSILDAHTAGEKISKRELMDGIELYDKLVRRLLT